MIVVHFIGDNNKPDQLEIHAGIIKNFTFLSNSLVIEFKRSDKTLAAKKGIAPGFTAWIWTKNVNDIINYKDVMAYLKALDLGEGHKAVINKIENNNTQQSLF